MTWSLRAVLALALTLAAASAGSAQVMSIHFPKPTDKMPWSGLAPAKPHPGLCLLSYRISTRSPECQMYFDQGLAYYYS